VLRVAEIDQRIETFDCLEDHIAALAAFATVRAAIFDELFAPEADGARSTRAGLHEDFCLIEEMHPGDVVARRPGG